MPDSDSLQASEEIRSQPISPIRELEASTTGLLGRYWNEERRQNMFRTRTPDTSPNTANIHTDDDLANITSPYEQKIVVVRPTTPEPEEAIPIPMQTKTTPTLTHTPLPAVSQIPVLMAPMPIHHMATAPVPHRIPTPPIRSPSPPTSRGPSPAPPNVPQNLIDDEPLQGREPSTFNGNRSKSDEFMHELKLYQFLNDTHPIIRDEHRRVAHALGYIQGISTFEWKRGHENWIMTRPIPRPPFLNVWDEFESDFLQDWEDVNAPHRAAAELDKLRMIDDDIDTYITRFAELARKALYHEDDPAVLDKFRAGLPLGLLEACAHHDEPRNWDAWTKSTRTRQAILTSIKGCRQTEQPPERPPSPMTIYLPTPPRSPSPKPMAVDVIKTARYVPPHRRSAQKPTETTNERAHRLGLCHLCGKQGHIQRYCPTKVVEALKPIMHAKAATSSPLAAGQGLKRSRSPTTTQEEVLRYLKRQTPTERNETVVALMQVDGRKGF
jgi:Retrotransposon gag protein